MSSQFIIVSALREAPPLTLFHYQYPDWSVVVGYCIGLSSFMWIPLYMLYKLLSTPGSLKQVRQQTTGQQDNRQQDNKTTRQQDNMTTRQQDNRTTRQQGNKTTGQQDNKTTRQHDNRTTDNMTTRQQDNMSTRQHDNKTTGQQDNRTTRQQVNRTTRQQENKTTGQQELCEHVSLDMFLPSGSPQRLEVCLRPERTMPDVHADGLIADTVL